VHRFAQLPGQAFAPISDVTAYASGSISWQFTPSCAQPVGTTNLYAVDAATNRQSNTVSQTTVHHAGCLTSFVLDTTVVAHLALAPSGMSVQPNPTTRTAVIAFSLSGSGTASLSIYNLLGQRVRNYIFERAGPGAQGIEWDCTAQDGHRVAPGIYFIKLVADNVARSSKLIVAP
jgi:flagellar hook assembly protein FlgD